MHPEAPECIQKGDLQQYVKTLFTAIRENIFYLKETDALKRVQVFLYKNEKITGYISGTL